MIMPWDKNYDDGPDRECTNCRYTDAIKEPCINCEGWVWGSEKPFWEQNISVSDISKLCYFCMHFVNEKCTSDESCLFSNGKQYEIEPDTQSAKADNGKPRLTLVPPSLIKSVAAIREYGCQKYGSDDNWKLVEPQRYRDALYRHWLAYLEGEVDDPESGLPHIWHVATNIAFLIEMEGKK